MECSKAPQAQRELDVIFFGAAHTFEFASFLGLEMGAFIDNLAVAARLGFFETGREMIPSVDSLLLRFVSLNLLIILLQFVSHFLHALADRVLSEKIVFFIFAGLNVHVRTSLQESPIVDDESIEYS